MKTVEDATTVKVVIPWRDRGIDMRRAANLDVVMAWWWAHGFEPYLAPDGGTGDDQFNRHWAYNDAVEKFPETDVFIFSEADMLIPSAQIITAIDGAAKTPGIVVPFTQYRYLSDESTANLRDGYHDSTPKELAEWWGHPVGHLLSLFSWRPESTMEGGKSIGAVNVVSRETIEQVGGFCELASGNWYDDNITEESFAYLAGPTRWVDGPAVHMYHLPGHKGDHLTDEDRLATQLNKGILREVRGMIRTRNEAALRDCLSYRRKRN